MSKTLSRLSRALRKADPRALPNLESVLPALTDWRDYAQVSVEDTDTGQVKVSLMTRPYMRSVLNVGGRRVVWQTVEQYDYAFDWRYGDWQTVASRLFDGEDVAAVSATVSDWDSRARELGGAQARIRQACEATRVLGRWLTEQTLIETMPLLQGRPGFDYPQLTVHTSVIADRISVGVNRESATLFVSRPLAERPWADLDGEHLNLDDLLATGQVYANAVKELLLQADREWFENSTQADAQRHENTHRKALARQTVQAVRAAAARP